MDRGGVGNNDLMLWWCKWLFQVQITFVFEKILEGEGDLVSSMRDGKRSTL